MLHVLNEMHRNITVSPGFVLKLGFYLFFFCLKGSGDGGDNA